MTSETLTITSADGALFTRPELETTSDHGLSGIHAQYKHWALLLEELRVHSLNECRQSLLHVLLFRSSLMPAEMVGLGHTAIESQSLGAVRAGVQSEKLN